MDASFAIPKASVVLPSLFQRWRRIEAVVMAEMEMRLMVGVTSTCRTFRPRDSSGGLSGSEFFMAFPSCSQQREIWSFKSESKCVYVGTQMVLPGEAGRTAPAGLCTECPPELLGPSPTLHCIYMLQRKTINTGMSTLKTGLSSSSLNKQECLRCLDVWVTSSWTINSILVMPAATSEGREEADIKDTERLKLLCHILYSTCNLKTHQRKSPT